LKTKDFVRLEKLAKKGKLKDVDLSVFDVIGSGIGIVPASATASNFANLKRPSKCDLSFGIQNMVGEVIAVSAIFAAKALKKRSIVFIGKTVRFKKVRQAICRVAKYYKIKVIFPKLGPIATAIGAAVYLSKYRK